MTTFLNEKDPQKVDKTLAGKEKSPVSKAVVYGAPGRN